MEIFRKIFEVGFFSKPFLTVLTILIGFAFFVSCKGTKLPGNNDIAIEWEVISNQFSENTGVKARFIIENKSRFTLDSTNWTLYFNQAPRTVNNTHEGSKVQVERINGDWYRIYPLEGFVLKPGEKVEIIYENAHWWVKESDAPRGLYFVFIDADGKEQIVEALNFRILPFDRPEQFTRHLNDHLPPPGAETNFANNAAMSLVPEAELPLLIPTPQKLVYNGQRVNFAFPVTIFHTEELLNEAQYLAAMLKEHGGGEVNLNTGTPSGANSIWLRLGNVSVNGTTKEAYRMRINIDQTIELEGSDRAGVFYGIQSILAMLPSELFIGKTNELNLPVAMIEDAPRFGYRGLHVDVSRNFQQIETIKKLIDLMAFYKLNVLHFHLTDDEGWRLEIPSLPELTQVGAQRGHTTMQAAALHPAYGSGPFPNAPGKNGCGFYTRQQYIDLLKYANNKHIKIIPEINLPGHARAAIKSMEARYQRFMAEGNEAAANEFRLIDPEETSVYLTAQLFTDNVVNVARESAYKFLETVLDDVISMYAEANAPLDILHIGGDEVPAGAWTKSPMIDELMKTRPDLKVHANMHKYFTERALEIFAARNLQMAGWEEVGMYRTETNAHAVFPGFAGGKVIPYAWNSLWGQQDLAYRFANAGFPVVLCHVTNFYFDLAYNNDPREPGLCWGGFVNTRDAWHYNPFNVFNSTLKTTMGQPVDPLVAYAGMERLRPDARKNILGLQAQLWSETIHGPEMLEYYVLPKLLGFSESAWAPARVWETTPDATLRAQQVEQGWNVFANAIARKEFPRLSKIFGGFNYRVPPPGAIIQDGKLLTNVEYPGLTVRYTVDGSEPTMNSTEFTGPIEVTATEIILRAFDITGKGSLPVTLKTVK